MDAHALEHLLVPVQLRPITQRPFWHPNTAGEDVLPVVILGLSERRKRLRALLAPAIEEIKGKGGEGAEDRVDVPHTTHIFNLAVLILLPLSHRHDHARR